MLLQRGDLNAAESLFLSVREGLALLLPRDHPEVLKASEGVALTLERQNKHAEAESIYKDVLVKYVYVGDENTLDVLKVIHSLACIYEKQGRLEESCSEFESFGQIAGKVLGNSHPFTLYAKRALAMSHLYPNKIQNARQRCTSITACLEIAYRKDFFWLARALCNLARIYIDVKIYDLAQEKLDRALHGFRSQDDSSYEDEFADTVEKLRHVKRLIEKEATQMSESARGEGKYNRSS